LMFPELGLFGRALHRSRRRLAARYYPLYLVKVWDTDEGLMLDRLIPLPLLLELSLLEARIGGHALRPVRSGELEDGVVHRVEPCECYELEIVSHSRQLRLKRAQPFLIEPTPPVEGRGAVVGE